MACASHVNASDMLTKKVGIMLFSHHNDHIYGRITFFRINPHLLLVPRHASGARGGVLVFWPVLSGVPGFPQPRSKYIT
jgi:hypothetical protein